MKKKPRPELTPEQMLKNIFLHLRNAERLDEPERTNQLRSMIYIGLEELSHVKMPKP